MKCNKVDLEVNNGNYLCDGELEFGTMCNFTCNYGYELTLKGHQTSSEVYKSTCDSNGNFEPEIPECVRSKCTSLTLNKVSTHLAFL